MVKNMKKLFALVITLCMLMGQISILAFAAESGEDSGASETQKVFVNGNKTATELDEDLNSEVTLSLQGDNSNLGADIVFIMGSGPASSQTTLNYISDAIKEVLDEFGDSGATVKLGLICFANSTEEETVLPLTVMQETDAENLDPTDMDYIIGKALERYSEVYDGVNMESVLLTAQSMLDADTTVPAERKHMILVSTGYTYFFDDEEGNPATIVGTNIVGQYMWGQKYYCAARNGTGNVLSGMYVPFNWDWDTYWNYVKGWVEADGNDYVYSLPGTYADLYSATYTDENGKTYDNMAEVKPNNSSSYRYGWALQVPEYAALAEDVAVPFFPGIEGKINPTGTSAYAANAAHALNYERAQYDAYQVYTEMQEAGYNCYSILTYMTNADGSHIYENDDEYIYIGECFMDMLAGGEAIKFSQTSDYFAPIYENIFYSIFEGSTITDYIGYDADEAEGYNFDFVDAAESITLKVGNKVYTTAKAENAKEGATSTYTFTAPEATEATFALDYYYGDGTTNEYFVWTINENISSFAPVSLTYKVNLVTKSEVVGEHTADTNIEAYIIPVDSDGNVGEKEYFPVPSVEYEVPAVTYTITVNYYDAETGDVISESYSTTYTQGEVYDVTEKDAIAIEGYEYDSTDGDALTGTLDGDKVINVYYNVVEEIPDEDVPLDALPNTGDSAPAIWFAVACVSATLMVVELIKIKRQKVEE